MAGAIVEHNGKRGRTFAIRFTAYGKRRFVTLGSEHDGWTRARAEDELQAVLRDVRRGVWRPAEPPPAVEEPQDPSFHAFASEWMAGRRGKLQPSNRRQLCTDTSRQIAKRECRHGRTRRARHRVRLAFASWPTTFSSLPFPALWQQATRRVSRRRA